MGEFGSSQEGRGEKRAKESNTFLGRKGNFRKPFQESRFEASAVAICLQLPMACREKKERSNERSEQRR